MASRADDVLVVGGGLSGLACALAAARRGGSVKVFEAEGSLYGAGGRASLHRVLYIEQRPEDRLPLDLLKELGIELPADCTAVEVLKSLAHEVMHSAKIQVFTNCRITRLLYAEKHCCGCVYSSSDGEVHVQGKVILCCGGVLSDVHPSASLLARHRPDLLHLPIPLGLGCGALVGHVVHSGAQSLDLQRFKIYATAEAQSSRRARRFVPRELRGHLMCCDGEVQQGHRSEEEIAIDILQRGPCWLIRSENTTTAKTALRHVELNDLAEEMQVSPSRIRKVLGNEGEEFESKEMYLWATQVTPALLCCEGGLVVEGDSGAVLSQDEELGAIPGLYAAGEAVASSGSSVSSCVSSALRAATACVAADPVPQTCGAAPGKEVSAVPEAGTAPAAAPSTTVPLQQRLALSRLDALLKTRLTAETLQKALLRSLKDEDFDSAVEELLDQLGGQEAQEAALQLELRDPVSGLSTRPMRTNLPEESGTPTNAQVSGICVHCRLPLKFQVSAELKAAEAQANGHALPEETTNGRGFAYATLLYGSGVEYFLGALVLGWSLLANGCQEERLLLHTKDVPEVFLDVLQTYWTLHEVEYLNADRSLYFDKEQSRFQAVFTKIQVLSCTDYSKVLMMDLDMLVRGNLDELFHLRAPAALKRCSGREQPEHGGDYVSEDFYKSQGDAMNGGMNAGLMLLEPNLQIYHRMCREIEDPWHPEHLGSYTPEQDYLGRFYGTFACGKWTHLHAKFNYQPNLPDNYVGSAHRAIDVLQDVMVAHYSGGRVKPWKLPELKMNVEGVRRLLEEDALQDHMGRPSSRANGNAGSSAPRTMMMDGQSVEVARQDDLPEDVRQLMWEWVLALRQCNEELLQDGVDILSLIESV